jgi:hypothetical protein
MLIFLFIQFINHYYSVYWNKSDFLAYILALIQLKLIENISKFLLDYYYLIKKNILDYLVQNMYFIVYNFQINLKNCGLNFAMGNLIRDIYPIVIPRNFNFIALIFFSYYINNSENFINGEVLDLQIKTYISNILYAYIGFIFVLDLSYCLDIKKKNVNEKKILFYNILFWVCIIVLFLMVIFILYSLDKLILYLINKIGEFFINYIIKMMASSGGGNNKPGGFGQPVGGGGLPPEKPGGFQPPKGHYNEDDSDTGYSSYFGSSSSENEEEKKEKEKKKNYVKTWDPHMTDQEKVSYNEYQNLNKREQRKRYSEDKKREVRDKENKARKLKYKEVKSNETPEERRARLDKRNHDIALTGALNDAFRTPEENKALSSEKQRRLRINKAKWKANLTEDKKRENNEKKRLKEKQKILNETPEERRARLDRKNQRRRERNERNKDKDKK